MYGHARGPVAKATAPGGGYARSVPESMATRRQVANHGHDTGTRRGFPARRYT